MVKYSFARGSHTDSVAISRIRLYSGAKIEIIFELAKISHKNLRLLYVLPLNLDKLIVKGVNFDTICEWIGLIGYIIYLEILIRKKNFERCRCGAPVLRLSV